MKVAHILKFVMLGAFAATAGAAPIIVPTLGSITGTVVVDANTLAVLAFDVRSDAVLSVSNPSPLGTVPTTDGGNPSPNNLLTVFNSAFTEAGVLTLDGMNGVFVTGPDFLVASTGSPITAITDPALALVLQPLVFDFTVLTGSQIDANTLGFTLGLNQIIPVDTTAPEPATLSMILVAALAGFGCWRRNSNAG